MSKKFGRGQRREKKETIIPRFIGIAKNKAKWAEYPTLLLLRMRQTLVFFLHLKYTFFYKQLDCHLNPKSCLVFNISGQKKSFFISNSIFELSLELPFSKLLEIAGYTPYTNRSFNVFSE